MFDLFFHIIVGQLWLLGILSSIIQHINVQIFTGSGARYVFLIKHQKQTSFNKLFRFSL